MLTWGTGQCWRKVVSYLTWMLHLKCYQCVGFCEELMKNEKRRNWSYNILLTCVSREMSGKGGSLGRYWNDVISSPQFVPRRRRAITSIHDQARTIPDPNNDGQEKQFIPPHNRHTLLPKCRVRARERSGFHLCLHVAQWLGKAWLAWGMRNCGFNSSVPWLDIMEVIVEWNGKEAYSNGANGPASDSSRRLPPISLLKLTSMSFIRLHTGVRSFDGISKKRAVFRIIRYKTLEVTRINFKHGKFNPLGYLCSIFYTISSEYISQSKE